MDGTARADKIESPGAITSGFILPSEVGPRDENAVTLSNSESLLKVEPTEISHRYNLIDSMDKNKYEINDE